MAKNVIITNGTGTTQLINDTIPQLAENLAEKLGTIVTEADLDAAIEEIYGGSASDIIGGSSNP